MGSSQHSKVFCCTQFFCYCVSSVFETVWTQKFILLSLKVSSIFCQSSKSCISSRKRRYDDSDFSWIDVFDSTNFTSDFTFIGSWIFWKSCSFDLNLMSIVSTNMERQRSDSWGDSFGIIISSEQTGLNSS